MRNQGSLAAIIVVSLIGLTIVLFGSLRKKPRIVKTEAIAEVFAVPETAAFIQQTPPEEQIPEVTTVLMDEGRLIIGTTYGIYLLPSLNSDNEPIKQSPGVEIMHLNAILPINDDRYVGGDYLYRLDYNYANALDRFDLGTEVYSMLEFGEGLLVGTDMGLWYHCHFAGDAGCAEDTLLRDGVIITALAEDRSGLWVGTYGDGLYRFDGRRWQHRFLRRDTLIFDYVNALEYVYPFLWVGTDESIFRYNGGEWTQMFVSDSSEIYYVTTIMTTPAATYIGTSNGLLRFAQDSLKTVDGFEGMAIAGFCKSEKGVIVATRDDGIYTFNGKEELVSPEQLSPRIFAGDEENDVLAETYPEN